MSYPLDYDSESAWYMTISKASWDDLSARLEASGMERLIFMMTNEGRTVAGLEFGNCILIPEDDGPDMHVHSGRFSDYEVALGEEAFMAGHAAGSAGKAPHGAWERYTPSDTILDLKGALAEPL